MNDEQHNMELKIDKQNGDVAFNEELHKYFNVRYGDRTYTSVTTLISKYHEQFDAEFWSSYKALEALIGEVFVESGVKKHLLDKKQFDRALLDTFDVPEALFEQKRFEILMSYQKANKDGCDRGTTYHLERENMFYNKPKHKLNEYNFGLKLDGEFACEKHNFDLNQENGIFPEYLIYYSTEDAVLNMAGQIDILIKQGDDLYLLDYKTNVKGIDMKSYFDRKKKKSVRMFYPLNNYDDCKYVHYTLQLSIYAWMLQRINPKWNIKLLRIIHIDGDDKETFYDLDYLKDDVDKLMKHYKKQTRVDTFRSTGKIIG